MINLGKVGLTPKGAWVNNIAYERLDVVSYLGSSYVCIFPLTGTAPTGTLPTNTTYFQLSASKGDVGSSSGLAYPTVAPVSPYAGQIYMVDTASYGSTFTAWGTIGNTTGNVVPLMSGALYVTNARFVRNTTNTAWVLNYESLTSSSDGGGLKAWTASVYLLGKQAVRSGKIWQANADTVAGDIPGVSAKWDEVLTAYADDIDVVKITPTNFGTPPAIKEYKINDIDTFIATNSFVNLSRTFVVISTDHGVSTIDGYVKQFHVELKNAEVGRIVRWYILTKQVSDGKYLVKYDTGDIVAELDGNNYYSPTLGSVPILTNDVIGVYVKCLSTANGMAYKSASGQTLSSAFSLAYPFVVGTAYLTSLDSATYRYSVGATVVDKNLLVGKNWGNVPNGYAELNTDGNISFAQLPKQFKDQGGHTETPIEKWDNTKKSLAIVRESGIIENFITPNSGISGTFTEAGALINQVIVCWHPTLKNGFANNGILTEVRIPAVKTTTTGALIQCWIVRPSPIDIGRFELVQTVGELDASVLNRWHIFRGLAINVKAGDMIAVRAVGTFLPYYSGSTSTSGYSNVSVVLTDLTLSALNTPIIATLATNAGKLFVMEADIMPPSTLAVNSPGNKLRLDNSGYIPNRLGRSPDLYHQNRKGVLVGTSIPAGNSSSGGGAGAGQTYPGLVNLYLDANIENQAVGSSGICWDGTRNLSLSATKAELTAAYGAAFAVQSYEDKILGKGCKLVIFDHGHNDSPSFGNETGLPWTSRTGTITTTISTTTVSGVSTLFSTELKIGDKLYNDTYDYIGKIQSIESNTALTLTGVSIVALSNKVFRATNMDRTTFYGAFNYVIDKCYDENPLMNLAFITPPNVYTYGGAQFIKMVSVRDKIKNLAISYASPYLDLMSTSGYNPATYKIRTIDGVHPTEDERPRIANMLYNFLKGVS